MQNATILAIALPTLAIGSLIGSRICKARGDMIKSKEAFIAFVGISILTGLIFLGWQFLIARLPWSFYARVGMLIAISPFIKFFFIHYIKRNSQERSKSPRMHRIERATWKALPFIEVASAIFYFWVASIAFYCALGMAAFTGNTTDTRLVLALGLNPNGNKFVSRPIDEAAHNGRLAVVKLLVEDGAAIEPPASSNMVSPLEWATFTGNIPMAQYLIAHGAKVDGLPQSRFTPLGHASRKGQIAAAQLLLNNGANVNATNRNGVTPLMIASGNNLAAMTTFLIAHGAQVNTISRTGNTALTVAASAGSVATAKILIAHGANLRAVTNKGMTALSIAKKYKYLEMATLLENQLTAVR